MLLTCWTCRASIPLKHLTVSQSTSPAMDCQWWLKWTIVNWLLMRREIKNIALILITLIFLPLSQFVCFHCQFLSPAGVIFFSSGWSMRFFRFWFYRFPWQQYPYIILGGENPMKVECLTQEHNTATCPSLELRALDIYPSLPNISIHILPTVL